MMNFKHTLGIAAAFGMPLLLGACAQTPAETPAIAQPAAVPAEPEKRPLKPFPEDSFYDLLVAEFAIRRQHYDLALDHYMEQAYRTNDSGIIATAARLSQFVNNLEAALAATELWLQKEPDSAEAHFIRGTTLARARRPLDALPHMEAVIGSSEDSNFASLAASALALSENQQKAFETQIRAMLAKHPDNTNLKTGVALTLQYRNQEEEALLLIREVLAVAPLDIHALLIETRVLQQLNRIDEAIERLRFAVDQHPYHKRLRQNLAQLYTRSDIFQAKAQYMVLHNQFPEDSAIQLALALVNREIGEYDEAIALLKNLRTDAEQKNHALYFLGRIAEQREQWSQAREYYGQVGIGEQLIPALTRLAALDNEHQGLASARRTLTEARQRFPQLRTQLYLAESDLLFDQRQYKEGYNLLTSALDNDPSNTNLLYARSLFSERQRNLDLMERDLRVILSNDPDNATALNALGYSLANLTDRLTEAKSLISKALQLRPGDPAIQDSYGWVAYRLGDMTLARTYLERAYAQTQDHEIAAHLGEVLWLLGEQQQAISVWQTGLRDTPDSLIINETLQRLNVNLPTAEQP